jgi:hypothetical protein
MSEQVKAVVYLGDKSKVRTSSQVLTQGTIIFETDTNKLKISDGVKSVKSLSYLPFSAITSEQIANWNKVYVDFYAGGTITETDPTVPSHVKAITSIQIANWDNAYAWGNHASAGYLTGFTETDPTVPNTVKAITALQISNWDTAYGWGDHGSIGYLTSYTETDPTVSDDVKGITATQINNWDTAFAWGNHASIGYLTSESDPVFTASPAGGILSGDITNWNDGLLNRKGGNFYRRVGRWYTQADNANALTAVNHTTPSVFFVGFAVERAITIDALAVEVTTAGSAGSIAYMGIYNGDPTLCIPTTLVATSGSFAVNTTGTKSVTLASSVTLQPGLYFSAFSTGSSTAHQMRSLAAGNFAQIIGTAAAGGNQLGSYINGTRASFGALPADASTLTALNPTLGSIYAMWMRMA